MKVIGKHLTVDMYGCSFDILNSTELIKEALQTAAQEANMTILNYADCKFEPQGLTAVLLLSKSHISIHTYPELGFAAIDVFSCGDHSHPENAVKTLRRLLKPNKVKTTHLRRGDFGSVSDMKPKIKVSATPLRRVRDTGAKVIKFLSRSK